MLPVLTASFAEELLQLSSSFQQGRTILCRSEKIIDMPMLPITDDPFCSHGSSMGVLKTTVSEWSVRSEHMFFPDRAYCLQVT